MPLRLLVFVLCFEAVFMYRRNGDNKEYHSQLAHTDLSRIIKENLVPGSLDEIQITEAIFNISLQRALWCGRGCYGASLNDLPVSNYLNIEKAELRIPMDNPMDNRYYKFSFPKYPSTRHQQKVISVKPDVSKNTFTITSAMQSFLEQLIGRPLPGAPQLLAGQPLQVVPQQTFYIKVEPLHQDTALDLQVLGQLTVEVSYFKVVSKSLRARRNTIGVGYSSSQPCDRRGCCLERKRVNLSLVGIAHPTHYDVGYCVGTCSYPSLAGSGDNIASTFNINHKCCHVKAYEDITVLFRGDNGVGVYGGNLTNLSAASCTC